MLPNARFDHLDQMSTPLGLFEHAKIDQPRRSHGYCLDDVARGLVVTAREPDPAPEVQRLATDYLRFTIAAQDPSGAFHNRRSADGAWTDRPKSEDHWGRALWGLGVAAHGTTPELVTPAVDCALVAMRARSPYSRSMAYAALGAADIHRLRPDDPAPVALLREARRVIGHPGAESSWPWPESRLTYANAVLPEALLAIGSALGDDRGISEGLVMLEWLVDLQTSNGHLSPTPHAGWQPGEHLPAFDQQPIEVTALAEACWRAFQVSGETRWLPVLELAAEWFLGWNDVGVPLYDLETGGCCDGLHSHGPNANQGAESTLAALATLQLARQASLSGAQK